MSHDPVKGFSHIGLTVGDLAQASAFWQQVLGFQVQGEGAGEGELVDGVTGIKGVRTRFIWLNKAGLTLELVQYDAPDGRKAYRPRSMDIGSWHISLAVEGLDEVVSACQAWGWTINGQIMRVTEKPGPVGARVLYLHNADGTTLELSELKPAQNPAGQSGG